MEAIVLIDTVNYMKHRKLLVNQSVRTVTCQEGYVLQRAVRTSPRCTGQRQGNWSYTRHTIC